MSSNRKQWFVDVVVAESWGGKNGAPNINRELNKRDSLEDARQFVQRWIGKIAVNLGNKIEWIAWRETSVEVKFNYQHETATKVRVYQTVNLSIVEVDEVGNMSRIAIGD